MENHSTTVKNFRTRFLLVAGALLTALVLLSLIGSVFIQTRSNTVPQAETSSTQAVVIGAPMSFAMVMGPARVSANPFKRPMCTWWADERYKQMHGSYVPWTSNANAMQWRDRASQAGWQVSARPSVGSIIVLQPGVQGAGGVGHVAFVEKVLGNGRVMTSNMNWGGNGGSVVSVTFAAGSGVSFIRG